MLLRTTLGAVLMAGALTAQSPFLTTVHQNKKDHVSISFRTGDKDVTIIVQDKNAKAYVAGKLVQSAKLNGGVVRLKDKSGRELAVIRAKTPNGYVLRSGKRAHLGINVREPDEVLAEHLGLDEKGCVVVLGVEKDKPADKAGVKKHDIIVRIDDDEEVTQAKLTRILGKKKPGETIELEIVRRGDKRVIDVELGETEVRAYTMPGNTYWSTLQTGFPTTFSVPNVGFSDPIKGLATGSGGKVVPFLQQPGKDKPGILFWPGQPQAKPKSLEAEVEKLRKELSRLERLLGELKELQKK